jgi:hypothetical protein
MGLGEVAQPVERVVAFAAVVGVPNNGFDKESAGIVEAAGRRNGGTAAKNESTIFMANEKSVVHFLMSPHGAQERKSFDTATRLVSRGCPGKPRCAILFPCKTTPL